MNTTDFIRTLRSVSTKGGNLQFTDGSYALIDNTCMAISAGWQPGQAITISAPHNPNGNRWFTNPHQQTVSGSLFLGLQLQ